MNISDEDLVKIYVNDELNPRQIGQIIGVGGQTVRQHLIRLGVQMRGRAEAKFLHYRKGGRKNIQKPQLRAYSDNLGLEVEGDPTCVHHTFIDSDLIERCRKCPLVRDTGARMEALGIVPHVSEHPKDTHAIPERPRRTRGKLSSLYWEGYE